MVPNNWYAIARVRKIRLAAHAKKKFAEKSGGQPGSVSVRVRTGTSPKKQARNQPFTNCTYRPVLGSYNNWNIIELTPKSTPFEAFDEIHKVVLDGISENTASLVQSIPPQQMDSMSFNPIRCIQNTK